MDAVVVPRLVFPLNVSQVIVHVPLVAEGNWLARLVAGVHETLVLLVFVTIVPVLLPYLYVSVCVYELFSREIVIVCAVPSVPLPVETLLLPAVHTGYSVVPALVV